MQDWLFRSRSVNHSFRSCITNEIGAFVIVIGLDRVHIQIIETNNAITQTRFANMIGNDMTTTTKSAPKTITTIEIANVMNMNAKSLRARVRNNVDELREYMIDAKTSLHVFDAKHKRALIKKLTPVARDEKPVEKSDA